MKIVKKASIMMTFVFVLFGLFGCDNTPKEIDLSNIENVTINFETNSDSSIDTIVVNQDLINSIDEDSIKNVTLDDLTFLIPIKDGYEFENWYFDEGLSQPLVVDSPILEEYIKVLELESVELEITLYAKWIPEKETYTITYHLDGGTNNSANPSSLTDDESVTLLNPSRVGYTFIEWSIDVQVALNPITVIPVGTTSNVDLYATWEIIDDGPSNYDITYHLNGGINNNENPSSFSNDETTTLLVPSKEGFTFLGWYDNSTFSNDAISLIPVGVTLNVVLYASWEEEAGGDVYFDVTYHLDGGTNPLENVRVYKTDDEDIKLLDGLKDGATFMGWYTDDDFTNVITVLYNGTSGDIDLWAKWGDASMLTFELRDNAYYVKGCDSDYVGIIEVPGTFNDLPVVGIGYSAFSLVQGITQVILPASVTVIESSAFYNCDGLTSINIELVTTIGTSAFEKCDSLKHIVIGDGVTSIEPFTFNGCDNLLTVVLGENVTSIGRQAFSFSPLTSITLNDGLLSIGESAFTVNSSLEELYIPSSVTYIGKYAFTNIENLVIYAGADFEPGTWENEWNKSGVPVHWGYERENVPVGAVTYTITYYLDDGTNDLDNPRTFKGETDIVLQDPIKVGYVFDGWYTDSDLTQSITTIAAGHLFDVSLWASWAVETAPTYLNYEVFDDHVVVTGLNTNVSVIEIPETYQGKPVTVITANAFSYNRDIVSVTLPDTIITIEDLAFANCDSLATINFPASLTSIGIAAFANVAFTELVLPETIISYGKEVFNGNMKLIEVTLPDNMTVIVESMFSNCEKLERINMPVSVQEIREDAFASCYSLLSINLSQVRVIGESAFSQCNSITTLVLSEQLLVIDNNTFYAMASLASVTLPQNLEVISYGAFRSVTNLTEIELPESLVYIGHSAFAGAGLESLNLPNSLTYIGKEAFKSTNITTLYIPYNVEYIGEVAFWRCEDLRFVYLPHTIDFVGARVFRDTDSSIKVYLDGSAPDRWDEDWNTYFNGTIYNDGSFDSVLINYNLDGGINNEANSSRIGHCSNLVLMDPTKEGFNFIGWYFDADYIEEATIVKQGRLTTVPLYALWEAQSVNQHSITYHLDGGKNLTETPYYFNETEIVRLVEPTKAGYIFLGWYDDSNYTNQMVMVTSNTVEDVEFYAKWEIDFLLFEEFDDYVAVVGLKIPLTVVEIPSSYNGKPVTVIGESAFYNEWNIREVILPSTITTIGVNAFASTSNLQQINLPEGLLTLNDLAFSGCRQLTEITIPSTVTSLGKEIFWGCSNLETIIFNNQMTILPEGMFRECMSLTEIVIPEGITEIGRSAFEKCRNLESVTLPSSLLKIGRYAFEVTSKLTSIIFPNSLLEIGNEAFSESGLTTVYLPSNLTTLGVGVFESSSDLISITINENLETVLTRDDFIGLDSLSTIVVDPLNPIYYMDGNALIVDNGTVTLIKYVESPEVLVYSIPVGVEVIGRDSFTGTTLHKILIPNTVTYIDYFAFGSCDNLINIYIPSSVQTIKRGAFFLEPHIRVFVEASEKPIGWDYDWVRDIDVYWGYSLSDIGLYDGVMDYIIVDGHVEVTGLTNYEGSVFFEIPSSILGYPVTTIRSNVFNDNKSGKIIIPDSVTTISEEAFNSYNVDIYNEADSIPLGWDSNWNSSKGDVEWGVIWFTFDTQGGDYSFPTVATALEPKSIGYGWIPVRTAYEFEGWYTDAACTAGNEFVFPVFPEDAYVMPTVNTIIYAKWTHE